jgi:hypothetical protein
MKARTQSRNTQVIDEDMLHALRLNDLLDGVLRALARPRYEG